MRGSILLLCLVFIAAISVAALGAMQSAWSGQTMSSAYLSHHRAVILLEQQLLQAEYRVWQHWAATYRLPGADFLHTQPGQLDGIVLRPLRGSETISAITGCEPLFELIAQSVSDTEGVFSLHQGRAAAVVRWDLCCERVDGCALASELRRVRHWSRSLWSEP